MRRIRLTFMLTLLCLLLLIGGGLAHAEEPRPADVSEINTLLPEEAGKPTEEELKLPSPDAQEDEADKACLRTAYFFWEANCTIGPGFDTSGYYTVAVQWILYCRGYYGGQVDGIYGSRTTAAVQAYQRDHGLPTAGVVGPRTWSHLQLHNLVEVDRNSTYIYYRTRGCSGKLFAMQHSQEGGTRGRWWVLPPPFGPWQVMTI